MKPRDDFTTWGYPPIIDKYTQGELYAYGESHFKRIASWMRRDLKDINITHIELELSEVYRIFKRLEEHSLINLRDSSLKELFYSLNYHIMMVGFYNNGGQNVDKVKREVAHLETVSIQIKARLCEQEAKDDTT